MPIFRPFRNLKIRYKLFISYSLIFIIVIAASTLVIYSIVKKIIEKNIESELTNSTATIQNMVKTAADVSIKNHLRAVSEKNKDIVTYFYYQFETGKLTETEAKARASEVLLSQRIGTSGYIYVLDSSGKIVIHPSKDLIGADISGYGFVKLQISRKEGYIEYDWKNPGETSARPKALYMTCFKPWDWIISASSYRKEFRELVTVSDFRESILSIRFGETGYSYIFDRDGNFILHPKLEGKNFIDAKDATGRLFIKEICKKKSGKIIYPWKNPGETRPREKLVIFNYLPEFDWIVASSSYLEEFYAPLRNIQFTIIIFAFFSLIIVLAISLKISASITTPIQELMQKISKGAQGDFTVRMDAPVQDEVGQLAGFFNSFMGKLEAYEKSLKSEIHEREQMEQALRHSDEMFSKAFNLSPNGICITSKDDMRFISVNESFLKATGYGRDEIIGKTFTELSALSTNIEDYFSKNPMETPTRIRNLEIVFTTKRGARRFGLLSSETIELWGKTCVLSAIEDVTDIRHLEMEILATSERERQKIGQDLHDDLGPHLIGIEVLGKVLEQKLSGKSFQEEKEYAAKIRLLIKEAIEKTRRMARGLCPVFLVSHGLETALKELAENTSAVFNLPCEFHCPSPVHINDNTVATHLYHIAQEAVQNAVKHGEASCVKIDLVAEGDRLHLSVADDGKGISFPAESKGMGLNIMRFRARMIGAAIEIRNREKKGTLVSVSLKS